MRDEGNDRKRNEQKEYLIEELSPVEQSRLILQRGIERNEAERKRNVDL